MVRILLEICEYMWLDKSKGGFVIRVICIYERGICVKRNNEFS